MHHLPTLDFYRNSTGLIIILRSMVNVHATFTLIFTAACFAAAPPECVRRSDCQSSGLPTVVKLGLACPHPEGLSGVVHHTNGVQVG